MEKLFGEIHRALPALELRRGVPYREVTSLGAGGMIPLLAEPAGDIELAGLLNYTWRNRIPVFILGGGTNVVGCDAEFDGLVVRLAKGDFCRIRDSRRHLTAGAGVRLSELARFSAERGLGGLAALAGIPGTVGGAVRMNAGAAGDWVGNHVLQLCGCRLDGTIWTCDGADIDWQYRRSSIPEDVVITAVLFQMSQADAMEEKNEISRELERRRAAEPRGRTAGCMFRNVSPDEPAGRLIDGAGLKGMTVGGATVSAEHANFIVNRENASEADIVELMTRIRRRVAEKYGFYLIPEVVFMDPASRRQVLEAVPAPRVLVLKGGVSTEREISLRSGRSVADALRRGGYAVEEQDLTRCAETPEMSRCDVVYPVLHGGFGEDGRLQKILEDCNFRFVGSGSVASDLVMDKLATKKMLDDLEIPTARWTHVTAAEPKFPAELKLPVVLKAPREGSTIGIEIVRSPDEWPAALERELKLCDKVLVEEFIEGVEISVPVVNGKVLPAVEIHSPHGFYDYDAKYVYNQGHTEYFCPAEHVSSDSLKKAAEYTIRFYEEAGCRDILRVDFIIGRDGVPYVLEGNSLPGCTATSLVPKSAKVTGMSFERMTATLAAAALKRPEATARGAR